MSLLSAVACSPEGPVRCGKEAGDKTSINTDKIHYRRSLLNAWGACIRNVCQVTLLAVDGHVRGISFV